MIHYRNWIMALTVLLGASNIVAEETNPLLSWQFAQQISLPETVISDPNAQFMFADELLLVADNAIQAGTCGAVLVFSIGSNDRYQRIQRLEASDFGQNCDQPDGFGFSLAYSEGDLYIGAPGDIFATDAIMASGALPDGEVYIYSRGPAGFFSTEQIISGTGETGNQAWGTKLEAGEGILLIQGNQFPSPVEGMELTLHGFASPNRVNQFELSPAGQWRSTRVLTNSSGPNTSEIYAQDFAINESGIFITKVNFRRANEEFEIEFYGMELKIYSLDSAGGNMPIQEVSTGRSIRSNAGALPRTKTVIAQSGSFLLAGLSNGFRSIGRAVRDFHLPMDYVGYVLEGDTWVLPGNDRVRVVTVPGELVDFSDQGLIAFNSRTPRSDEILLETITSTALGDELVQRERFVNESEISIETVQRFAVNDDRMILARNRNGRLVLEAFEGIPALDAAITQAWWFGPEFNGQGVTFEVLRKNRLLMHWFTYDLSGNQMWLRGVGSLEDGVINIPLVRAMGPRFRIIGFDPADRMVQPWGNVSISFSDCKSGQLSYQSDEFGSGQLPLLPVTDNGTECGRGFFNITEPSITGSYFDPDRAGEGLIFLPAQRFPAGQPVDFQPNVLGLWLTYTPAGEQAWYYLGVYEDCRGEFVTSFSLCLIKAIDIPRSTVGPMFGPGYNPNDRISRPWGRIGPLEMDIFAASEFLSIFFDNPHDRGRLFLEQVTQPIF